MQVGRPMDDNLRRFPLTRVGIAPVSGGFGSSYQRPTKSVGKMEEVCLDVMPHCTMCGIPVRPNTVKMMNKLLCQGCRRREFQRQGSVEDIRPASPMAGKPKMLNPVKSDGRVHPSWTTETEVESEPETSELSAEHSHLLRVKNADDAGSFRSMEVLTCFRSQVHRGLRLLLKAATAETWHMWWAILLSMLLMPTILTLMVVAGVGFLVLSAWVAMACVVVYPIAYINPRLYTYAMDS
ncbi:hypothetical protein PRNP1_000852 [Phytophthora ramorum]